MTQHTCVADINARLAHKDTVLANAISFSQPERELIQITTVKLGSKRGVRPVAMFASFCPFCGVKLGAA